MKYRTNPSISIITPLYNRAHLIRGCYESLDRQSLKDFEWTIVDDGSIDHPDDIINGFESEFSITYIKKSNGGSTQR